MPLRVTPPLVVLALTGLLTGALAGCSGGDAPSGDATTSSSPSSSIATPSAQLSLKDAWSALPRRQDVDGAVETVATCRPGRPARGAAAADCPRPADGSDYVSVAYDLDHEQGRLVRDHTKKGNWLPERVQLRVHRYDDDVAAELSAELRPGTCLVGELSQEPSQQPGSTAYTFGYTGTGDQDDDPVAGMPGYRCFAEVSYSDPDGNESEPQEQGVVVVAWDRWRVLARVDYWSGHHDDREAVEVAEEMATDYVERLARAGG